MVGQARIVKPGTTNGWHCYEFNLEYALGGKSHVSPAQHFPCQGELSEHLHLSLRVKPGASVQIPSFARPCTMPPRRLPLLCKLMLVPHAVLTFHSFYDCTAGRGLVPPCAKRSPRWTSGQAQQGSPIQSQPKGPSLSSRTNNQDGSSPPDIVQDSPWVQRVPNDSQDLEFPRLSVWPADHGNIPGRIQM